MPNADECVLVLLDGCSFSNLIPRSLTLNSTSINQIPHFLSLSFKSQFYFAKSESNTVKDAQENISLNTTNTSDLRFHSPNIKKVKKNRFTATTTNERFLEALSKWRVHPLLHSPSSSLPFSQFSTFRTARPSSVTVTLAS